MAPRETENNAYAKFWGVKQRRLWYVMVFSGVVNCRIGWVTIFVKLQTVRINLACVACRLDHTN